MKSLALDIRNHLRPHLSAVTVEHPHNDGLAVVRSLQCGLHLQSSRAVHRLRLGADEGLVNLNRTTILAAQLVPVALAERQPYAVKHKPCGLLSHCEVAGYFVATDTILAVHDQPDGGEPLVQREWRILEHAASLHGELLMAIAVHALPDSASAEVRNFTAPTVRTHDTIKPAHRRNKVHAHVNVGEVSGSLQETRGELFAFHSHHQ